MARKDISWPDLPYLSASNEEIAQAYGVSSSSVATHRKLHGSPNCRRDNLSRRNVGVPWDRFTDSIFGVLRDSEIARALLLNHSTVREARRRRGVPSRRQGDRLAALEELREIALTLSDQEEEAPPDPRARQAAKEGLQRQLEENVPEKERRRQRRRLRTEQTRGTSC